MHFVHRNVPFHCFNVFAGKMQSSSGAWYTAVRLSASVGASFLPALLVVFNFVFCWYIESVTLLSGDWRGSSVTLFGSVQKEKKSSW